MAGYTRRHSCTIKPTLFFALSAHCPHYARPPRYACRRIALGKAEGVVDCTAEEAAAWYFEYCGRERLYIDKSEGNPARLEIKQKEKRVNEKQFAAVKNMPFPLRKREFVFKHIWRR